MKRVNVKYDENNNAIIDFVNDTKEGKYTERKPDIEFIYQRIDIQEQNDCIDLDGIQEESYLLGITSSL
jgi:hypothetical protein